MDQGPAENEESSGETPSSERDGAGTDEPDSTAAADPETVADAAAEIADRVVGGRSGGDEPTDDDRDDTAVTIDGDGPEPLTISLPDGSESVAAAIRSNREMLAAPAENGLAPAEAVTELRETIDRLAEDRPDDLTSELAGLETATERLADRVARQDRELRELREVVRSLAEILGASVEFQEATDTSADESADGDGPAADGT